MDREAFLGSIGPSFQWALLNYGRIANNVRVQDARFQELIANYQNTVLNAGAEVENGLVSFLRSKNQAEDAARAVTAETAAFHEAFAQYKGGLTDYNRVVVIQERLVTRQQSLADAQGAIAQGLIQVYRSLGGGWQIRMQSEAEFMMPIETPVPAVPPAPAPVEDDVTGDDLPLLEEPGLGVIPQSE